MEFPTLTVFATDSSVPPLRLIQQAFEEALLPADVGDLGPVTELNTTDWETVFLRWKTPEVHEIALLERLAVGQEEQADTLLTAAQARVEGRGLSAGKFLVAEHLKHTRLLYACQVMPALLDDDNHAGWSALDVALRSLAENADGIIYAENEGFYDADGEPLLADSEETDEITDEDEDE